MQDPLRDFPGPLKMPSLLDKTAAKFEVSISLKIACY